MPMTSTTDEQITAYFTAQPEAIAWPYPLYADLQARGDGIVHWDGGPAYLVTRYADVKAVMSGDLPIGNDGYRYGTLAEGVRDRLPPHLHSLFYKVFDFETLYLSRHDGERHQRLRRVGARAFTARRVEKLREKVQSHVDDLLDDLAASPSPDWKADVADRLPVRVIADLLGVPQSDRGKLWEFAETIAAHFSVSEKTLQDADAAIEEFKVYVQGLIDDVRRTGEGPDLAKVLIEGVDSGAMSGDELVAMYLLILFGGSETTTNLLGNGFHALQRFRDQWDLVVADPDLLPNAVEEMMRYDSALHYLPRTPVEDVRLGETDIPAGHSLIIMIGAANRDPRAFAAPDEFDVRRSNAAQHLGLAFGPHFCMGAALARMEAQIAFRSLVERFPEIRLTAEEVPHRGSAMLRAIASLPVDLGPERPVDRTRASTTAA